MWSQLFLLAGSFGLGYYFATRGSGVAKPAPADDDGETAMAGAFPEQHKAAVSGDIDCNGSSEGLSSKKKNKKIKNKGQAKKLTNQQALSSAEVPESVPERSPPGVAEAPLQEGLPDAVDVGGTSNDAENACRHLEAAAGAEEEASTDEWTAVDSMSAACPTRQASAGIPTHASVWSGLAHEEDLSREKTNTAPARVLRIGSPSRPPPTGPVRVHREYTSPEPLTKKQRQNQRRTERMREQRALNTTVQEHRLRQHQIALADLRSREQWAKAKRNAAKTAPPPKSSKTPNSSASVIDGKL
ncbi:hypothetical protein GGI20_004423, partial [Coemansia sp. BCRC 34301]